MPAEVHHRGAGQGGEHVEVDAAQLAHEPQLSTGRRHSAEVAAVQVRGIVENNAPPTTRYEPGNPSADANGNVYVPTVNAVEEMVDMISASRAYQNNVEVMNTSKDLLLATLKLGQ